MSRPARANPPRRIVAPHAKVRTGRQRPRDATVYVDSRHPQQNLDMRADALPVSPLPAPANRKRQPPSPANRGGSSQAFASLATLGRTGGSLPYTLIIPTVALQKHSDGFIESAVFLCMAVFLSLVSSSCLSCCAALLLALLHVPPI